MTGDSVNDDWKYKSMLRGRYIHENRDEEVNKIKDEYIENDETDNSGANND